MCGSGLPIENKKEKVIMEKFIEQLRRGELEFSLFVQECLRRLDEWDAEDFRGVLELWKAGQLEATRRRAEEAEARDREIMRKDLE